MGKMAQLVKGPVATNPDDLSLIHRPHMVEGENPFLSCPLASTQVLHNCMYIHTHTNMQ